MLNYCLYIQVEKPMCLCGFLTFPNYQCTCFYSNSWMAVSIQLKTNCLQQETIQQPRVRLKWGPQRVPMHNPNPSPLCL